MDKLKKQSFNWIKKNKTEFVLLVLIILIGAFLRLYRIADYMTFLGDEGRDAIIVRRLLVHGDLILIGPGTSIGNMYLGPLYYYLIAPSLLLANFSPVGPSIFVALVGLATIYLVWFVGRDWFPSAGSEQVAWGALIAAFLYAISPVIIIYSRSSWNPNVMPFFALLTIYSAWKMWFEHKYFWLIVAGISYAFVLQSHYLGLLLAPVVGTLWLIEVANVKNKQRRRLVKFSMIALAIFLFLMSPLVIFDARHGWNNFNAIKLFFTQRQTTVSAKPWNALPKMWPLFVQIISRVVDAGNELAGKWTAVGMAAILLWLSGVKKVFLDKKKFYAFLVLIFWIGIALVGVGVYKQNIYDHYFGFLFAAPFLLIGGMAQDIIDKHKLRGTWLVVTAVIIIAYFDFKNNPLRFAPNMQLSRTKEVAAFIEDKANGQDFNLAVIAERNYEDAYQYFLENWNTGVIDIDPLRSEQTIKDQLFVVCELPREKCDPTHNPKAEVANFGWSKIDGEWEFSGVTIYKLVHTQ
jgi:4-amino-4-deoxy-L-arabinose transferase-like glycosyltransferase